MIKEQYHFFYYLSGCVVKGFALAPKTQVSVEKNYLAMHTKPRANTLAIDSKK